jgi:hypothetical protein
MKITGTSSYIKVEVDHKTLKIQGELIVGGFLAYSDTISHWEPPYNNILIDENTKKLIIQSVINNTKSSKFKVVFDFAIPSG